MPGFKYDLMINSEVDFFFLGHPVKSVVQHCVFYPVLFTFVTIS